MLVKGELQPGSYQLTELPVQQPLRSVSEPVIHAAQELGLDIKKRLAQMQAEKET